MSWRTLVSAEALAAALGRPGVVPVDCRFSLADAGAGRRDWAAGHVPGAAHADLATDLSAPPRGDAAGRHPLPDEGEFARTLGRLGIVPGCQVVAYDAGDGAMAAARLWWLLRLWGHRDVAVLDGGLARWQALGLPVDTRAPGHRAPPYAGRFDPAAIAGADEVARRLGEAPGWLLDARAPERFRGDAEPIDPVAGHIPGARNRPVSANLREGRFKPADELAAEYRALLAGRPPGEVLLSCGSGVTACHDLLAMEHAGLSGARLYAGSWSGWIADPAHPVATGD